MDAPVKSVPVEDAYDDLLRRTLSKIPSEFERLIYLASTRDYNTGAYRHDGLAARFSVEAACKALEVAHRRIFHEVSAYPLEELVEQFEVYLQSCGESPRAVLRVWQELEPYRLGVPMEANPVSARLFLSNVRLVLAIFHYRQKQHPVIA